MKAREIRWDQGFYALYGGKLFLDSLGINPVFETEPFKDDIIYL